MKFVRDKQKDQRQKGLALLYFIQRNRDGLHFGLVTRTTFENGSRNKGDDMGQLDRRFCPMGLSIPRTRFASEAGHKSRCSTMNPIPLSEWTFVTAFSYSTKKPDQLGVV